MRGKPTLNFQMGAKTPVTLGLVEEGLLVGTIATPDRRTQSLRAMKLKKVE